MLLKIIDCESFETSEENLYDGISSSEVASLQCSDCNFSIKNSPQIFFFLEYVAKTRCL